MSQTITILQPAAEVTNPHVWTDSRAALSIRYSIYEALVKQDASGQYLPSIATRWLVADDARTWTFKIRSNVRFHDGTLLTVEDVIASLRHAASKSIPGSYGTDALLFSYLGNARFNQVDNETIRVVTSEPMADLLDLLVNTMIVPGRTLTESGVSEIIGSGPFRLHAAEPGKVILQRFDAYWGAVPSAQELVFRAEPDVNRRVEAFLLNEADIITYIPPIFEGQIAGAGIGSYEALQIHLCVILILNCNSQKCRDVRVRQALNYAVDVDAVIQQVMAGRANRLNGPLSQLHTGYNPAVAPYPYDPEKARRLLAEAGYPDGIELAFEVPTSSPNESLQLAELLVAQYQAAGIILKANVHYDRPAYAYMVKGKGFEDVCIFDSSPSSSYRVLREKIHSGLAGPWWANYANPAVDAKMEQAWGIVDGSKRNQFYQEISAQVYRDAPWVFLYNPSDGMAVRHGCLGWCIGVSGLLLFS